MKLKRFLTATLCVAMATTMAICGFGCGGSSIKVNPDKQSYKVGICQLVQHQALDAATQGFMDSLEEELAKEGRTVTFDNQNASGEQATVSTIINKFVTADVDLILANATACLQTASQATLTIPVLGTSITEYGVALGISNFTGVVGGNVSGTSDLADLQKQANMITTLLPNATRIGMLYCKAEANSDYQVKTVKGYLESAGKTVVDLGFNDANDIQTILTSATVDAIYVPTDNTAANNTGIINQICDNKGIPVIAGEEGICNGCPDVAIATLSISYYNLGVKTGKMAAEILLGKSDISTMSVAYDESPVYKYNPTACTRFGVSSTLLTDYTAMGE